VGAAAALAAQHGESAHGGTDNTTLWKLLNFGMLALALGFFIYKKAGGFFAARSAEIQKGLVEAAKVKEDAEIRYADMERRLKTIGTEVEALRKQAREESAAESTRAKAETERELKKIQAQAEQEIAAAAKSARQELRAYSAELAIGQGEFYYLDQFVFHLNDQRIEHFNKEQRQVVLDFLKHLREEFSKELSWETSTRFDLNRIIEDLETTPD
jgi:F-type H+-transporting ATPase subunit b